MKIASVQTLVVPGEPGANLQRMLTAVDEAKALGADFVVLPECSNFGWTHISAIEGAVEIDVDPFVQSLREKAKTLAIYIAVGFVERSGDQLFNSAVLIGASGEILIHHRKINELDFARELYSTGNEVSTADTPFGRIGLMICADALNESDQVIERLVAKNADVILSPSAWAVPADHDNQATPYGSLWVDAYRRGIGNSNTWIVAASNVGPVVGGAWDGFICIGNSITVGPNSEEVVVSPFGVDAIYTQIIEI